MLILGYLYEFLRRRAGDSSCKDELSAGRPPRWRARAGDYLAQLSSDRFRLTWIAADGSVLYDTQADASSMESHADREEVQQALKTGEGESTRYSATLLQKTLYYARRLARRDGAAHLRQPRNGGSADRSACCSRCCWCWPRH